MKGGMMKLKRLVSLLMCILVLSAILCLKLGRVIQEEKYRCQTLTNKMQDFAEDALHYVQPVAGDWQKDNRGWIFIPTDGKNWAYWREKGEEEKFFTLLDLDLYKDQCDYVTLRPFQYRKAYSSIPVSLNQKAQQIDDVQNDAGHIWIETQEPGRLVFTALTNPLKFRRPLKLYVEIRNDCLTQRIKESQAFCWEPLGKFIIESYKEE